MTLLSVRARRCRCELRFSEPVERGRWTWECGIPMVQRGGGFFCPCCDLSDERAA